MNATSSAAPARYPVISMMQAADDQPRRFTADEVMQMVAAGIAVRWRIGDLLPSR